MRLARWARLLNAVIALAMVYAAVGSWARKQWVSVGLELLAAVVFALPAIAGRSPLAGGWREPPPQVNAASGRTEDHE